MANNNLTNAAKKIAEALEAIAKSDKTKEGKMAKLEQEKLLKLIGDKKKLDGIDAKMALAEKEYDRIVRSGWEESRRLVRVADDKIKDEMQKIQKKQRELADLQGHLVKREQDLVWKAQELESKSLASQDDAETRTFLLDERETQVGTTEKKVAEREQIFEQKKQFLKDAAAKVAID